MAYVRQAVAGMAGYVPGIQPQTPDYIKLNTNENSYPPSPRILEALIEAVGPDLRLYPDPLASGVRDKVAEMFEVKPEQVLAGNGGDDILAMAVRTFVSHGDPVVFLYPSYLLYEVLTRMYEGKPLVLQYKDDYSLPEETYKAKGKLFFLCNPNSPSGTAVSTEEVEKLLESFSGVVLVDEAYVDFAEENCAKLIAKHRNLLILRSLSKSFALAGLRSGYVVGDRSLIAEMEKVKDSFNTDRLSQAATVAALNDLAYVQERVNAIRQTRGWFAVAMIELGFFVYPSQANFVLVRRKTPSAKHVYKELLSRRILVRHWDLPRLDDCLRISIGTDKQMERVLEALREVLGGG